MAQPTARVEELAERMDVDAHAQIEIRFGHAADDRGEVKDRAGAVVDDRPRRAGSEMSPVTRVTLLSLTPVASVTSISTSSVRGWPCPSPSVSIPCRERRERASSQGIPPRP